MEKITRAQQAIITKNHIYEVALKLFKQDGYDKVTISRICKEAGVSVGNFYHYYSSKEEVLMEKYLEFDEWLDDLDLSKGVIESILAIIDLQTSGAVEIGSKVFMKVMETHLSTNGKYVSSDRKFNKYLYDLAQRGIEKGIFHSSYTAEEISETLLRICRGTLFDWSLRDGPYDIREKSKHDILIAINGFTINRQYK
ncbi:MAG: TetR/AcrR family transcriptional regulator [Erysipelotrichaceae bacterium]|nr:TetR/AcrR family transcriptional regulator [Erysipelotrichaceae bacterium]